MIRRLLVLCLAFGLIGCGEANRKPALPPSGKAAVAAPQGQQRPAPEPVSPERIQELIASLEKGEAKAKDFQGLRAAVANAAVPGLIAALKNNNPAVRREAIKVLHQYMVGGSPERKAALTALPSAEPALIAALKDQDAGVRKEAIEALMTAPGTKGKVSLFIDPLKDDSHFVRMRAAWALAQIGPDATDAVPALAAAMADSDEIVSSSATGALARVGLPAVPALVKTLRHQDPHVCLCASSALAEIGPSAKEAIPDLKESSKRPDPVLAAWSVTALTMIDRENHPPKEAVRMLIEVMKTSREVQVLGGAAYLLGRIGPEAKAGLPQLIEAIKHRDVRVHEPAFVTIGKLGPDAKEAVPALVHAMHDDYPRNLIPNYRAAETLGNIGPAAQSAVPALVKVLSESKDEYMRQPAAESLGKIGPAETIVPVLIETLKKEKSSVRRSATKGLGALGPAGKAAVPALVEALKEGFHDREAANALAAMGPDGLSALILAAKEQKAEVFAPAMQALASLGAKAKPAVPVLTEAIKDEYRRQWAAPALKQIDPETAAKLGLQQ